MAFAGQKLRRIPGGTTEALALFWRNCHRQSAQIRRRQLAEPHIDEGQFCTLRHLGHDARFADSRWTPDHGADWQLLVHQLLEVDGELGGFERHGADG